VRNVEGILDFAPIRLEYLAGIPETPRVFGERRALAQQGLKRRLVLQTRERELADVVGLAERVIVVRKERLERFLNSLLAVEGSIGKERRVNAQVHLCRSNVLPGA
jgi:hypothetical protein